MPDPLTAEDVERGSARRLCEILRARVQLIEDAANIGSVDDIYRRCRDVGNIVMAHVFGEHVDYPEDKPVTLADGSPMPTGDEIPF